MTSIIRLCLGRSRRLPHAPPDGTIKGGWPTAMTTTVEQLLARLGSGIESTPGVCGGDPRIAGSRIPVWTLEQYRRLGMTQAPPPPSSPGLGAAALDNPGAYAAAHPGEGGRQIRENEGG